MRSFLSLFVSLAVTVAVGTAVMGSPMHAVNTSSIAHRAPKSPVQPFESITPYLWNYAEYKMDIGVKVPVGILKGTYAPIRVSGVVGTDGTRLTGTAFAVEYPKQYRTPPFNTNILGHNTLFYDYQSLQPTNGSIYPPLTAGHAEEYLRDIEIDKEIRKLPGISRSYKEYIIEVRHKDIQNPNLYPHGISKEDEDKVKDIYRRANAIKIDRERIVLLNTILDDMIKLAKKYGKSEYGIIEDLQSQGNIIASFLGHAVKPLSRDGVVRSFIHSGGLNGEIVMWSEGLSLWMNLRLESDVPNDSRAVDTGDVKLFTLGCSGGKPSYCNPDIRGRGFRILGRFTRYVTAFQ